MTLRERFAANLRRQRDLAGMSQEEVGIRASLHRTEISLLERGKRNPKVDTVVKLAGALGIEPGALFDGITWEPGDLRPGRFKPARRVPCEHG